MLDLVIDTRTHSIGAFDVGRVLPFRQRRMVGPFIFFDRMGPQNLAAPIPEDHDVRPHPHIGLSTVTYLFEGQMTHRDSLGVEQCIVPGDLNWMTAGEGISHSERFDPMRDQGGTMDGIQSWVAVPEAREEDKPSFEHHPASSLPVFSEQGVQGRVVAGSAYGQASPVTTLSPLFYVDVQLQAGATFALPPGYSERAVYIASGEVEALHERYAPGQMLVFSKGGEPVVKALHASRLMVLGGEPLGPRHIWWNFVSSRKERIEQAKADWEGGRIALPPTDDEDFIPLPKN